MTSEISVRHVEKFDGSNFQSWRLQLRMLFTANDLLDLVTGARERPPAGEVEPRKQWVKDDAKAQFLISSSLDRSQHQHIQTC